MTVSEAEIAAGVRLAAEQSRLVAEPSGALSVAALAFRRGEAGLDGVDGAVVAVVSGGNVDPDRYREYLAAPIPPVQVGGRRTPQDGRVPALVGQALGQASLADADRGDLRWPPGGRSATRRAPRLAIQPATTARIAAMKMRSPAIHMNPAASF